MATCNHANCSSSMQAFAKTPATTSIQHRRTDASLLNARHLKTKGSLNRTPRRISASWRGSLRPSAALKRTESLYQAGHHRQSISGSGRRIARRFLIHRAWHDHNEKPCLIINHLVMIQFLF